MLDVDAVIDFLAALAEEENLRVTVKSSLLGGLVAGTATVLGGLLMGPVGLAVGGTVGGTVSYLRSRNQFYSVAEVLVAMNPKLKERLYEDAMIMFQSLAVDDVVTLHSVMNGNNQLREQLIQKVVDHVHNQLQMEICDGRIEAQAS